MSEKIQVSEKELKEIWNSVRERMKPGPIPPGLINRCFQVWLKYTEPPYSVGDEITARLRPPSGRYSTEFAVKYRFLRGLEEELLKSTADDKEILRIRPERLASGVEISVRDGDREILLYYLGLVECLERGAAGLVRYVPVNRTSFPGIVYDNMRDDLTTVYSLLIDLQEASRDYRGHENWI